MKAWSTISTPRNRAGGYWSPPPTLGLGTQRIRARVADRTDERNGPATRRPSHQPHHRTVSPAFGQSSHRQMGGGAIGATGTPKKRSGGHTDRPEHVRAGRSLR